MIVVAQPAGGKFLDFVKRLEQVMGETVVTNCPIVALNVRILSRLAGLDEIDADVAFWGTCQGNGADLFKTVVASNEFRLAALFDDSGE